MKLKISIKKILVSLVILVSKLYQMHFIFAEINK